jgi:hypothetical protein
MIPAGADALTDLLMILHKLYKMTERAYVDQPLPIASSGTTPQMLLDAIITAGMEKYRFVDDGVGCRHWVSSVVRLWEEQGLVGPGSSAEVDEVVGRLWTSATTSVVVPSPEGIFLLTRVSYV